jgi:hypothetical protein
MKTKMIAGHSNGQPSRKIRVMTSSSVTKGGTGRPTSALVITLALPSRAKIAPKTFEATARKSTMLVVAMVLNTADLRPLIVKRP